MIRTDLGVYFGVLSHNRPDHVEPTLARYGDVTWYVGKGEGKSYRDQGATTVKESGGLIDSRNAILSDAFKAKLPALIADDDCKKLQKVVAKQGRKVCQEIQIEEVVTEMAYWIKRTKLHLAGLPITTNPFYYNPMKPVDFRKPIACMMFVTENPLVFDHNFEGEKEDQDYAMQHIMKYGGAIRINYLLGIFHQKKWNNGEYDQSDKTGLQKTTKKALATKLKFKEKWKNLVRENPRNYTQVIFDV